MSQGSEQNILQNKFLEFQEFLSEKQNMIPPVDRIKIDLHCHDFNSNEPDELWGRILNLPETWLPTEDLIRNLKKQDCTAWTITNHNNARSCWKLMEKGQDILAGAEFTCTFPELGVKVHVLTFGFTPAQETILNRIRHNIYKFQAYTAEWNLPTVLPHPLYFYSKQMVPNIELFHKMMILFERFEVLNGQRDLNQNHLTARWVQSCTQEKIESWEKLYGLKAGDFCIKPYQKRVAGGSDDHMGFFAGSSGTYVQVPQLGEKLKVYSASEMALQGLLYGEMAPYGWAKGGEKLSAAFLDYFFQVAMHMKDPGLFRMFLHRGTLQDKMSCAAIANALFELRRHKHTMVFIKAFHKALQGSSPSLALYLGASKRTRPLLGELKNIARARSAGAEEFAHTIEKALEEIFSRLSSLFFERLEHQKLPFSLNSAEPLDWLTYMELPSHLRSLFAEKVDNSFSSTGRDRMPLNLDRLSFPLLATGVLGGAIYAGHRVLNKNRKFLDEFRAQMGEKADPPRVLWLTDSFVDANGVSTVLQSMYHEVLERNLPIDFLTLHPTGQDARQLKVLRPVGEWKFKNFSNHVLRVPNLAELFHWVEKGSYTHIICSTELALGPLALMLSAAFSIPSTFFMHTDWMEYFTQNSNLDHAAENRLRRILRAFYGQFDHLWVLNQDHRDWLCSKAMGINPARIHLTAHWPSRVFMNQLGIDQDLYMGHQVRTVTPYKGDRPLHLLFAGRLSEEKGLKDFVRVVRMVRKHIPDVKATLAGTGPLADWVSKEDPTIHQLGWVSPEVLCQVYTQADLLLFPSRFDTFGCTVLESMACGTPVIAYGIKGPKDIIEHEKNGWLTAHVQEMAQTLIRLHTQPELLERARRECRRRVLDYLPDRIIKEQIGWLGLENGSPIPLLPKGGVDTPVEVPKKGISLWEDLFDLVTDPG